MSVNQGYCSSSLQNSLGNHAGWDLHAGGMAEMIRLKGGLSSIHPSLQMKIYR